MAEQGYSTSEWAGQPHFRSNDGKFDTFNEDAIRAYVAEQRPSAQVGVATTPDATPDDLTELAGVEPHVVDVLRGAGYRTRAAIREASDASLIEIHGIGPSTVEKLRKALA